MALLGGVCYGLGLWLFAPQLSPWLIVAFFLFAIGFGCLRPLLTSLLGDQFDPETQKEQQLTFFAWSYVATNLGAFFGFLCGPPLKEKAGVIWAARTLGTFGLISAVIVLAISQRLVIRPPTATDSANGSKRQWRHLIGTFACVACFWLVYNRTHDRILEQAGDIGLLRGNFTKEQLQALNPLFIIFLMPFLRPLFSRSSDLQTMLFGFRWMVAFIAFTTLIQFLIALQVWHSIWLIVASYGLASVAEIFLVPPALHYFHQFSGNRRALKMGLFYSSIGAGEVAGAGLSYSWSRMFPIDTPWTKLCYFVTLAVLAVFATWSFLRQQSQRIGRPGDAV
jgi:dipeptide/tripeptide permease